MLARVLDRAASIRGANQVVVATATTPVNDPIRDLVRERGLDTFSGREADVLDRYYQAAKAYRADVVVRITADCPLLDADVSSLVLDRFLASDVDYVSNIHPPTYPDGLDTEVFSFDALTMAWREARLPSEREHVTPFIWNNSGRFKLANVVHDKNLADLRWTVDDELDLQFVRAVYERLGEHFGLSEVLSLLEAAPELARLNAARKRNEGYIRSLQQDAVLQAGT